LDFHASQFTTSAKKKPVNRFGAERTAAGVPAENFQSRAGREIVIRRKQRKNPPGNLEATRRADCEWKRVTTRFRYL